ncbi:uncharacterized protein LOC134692234 [Mytilus trossulus]|uniref:uncharacterized protein LOC134692234 n=1 Tax=Mytilus trossulus TaxID=6551 RepID=UPI0030043A4D
MAQIPSQNCTFCSKLASLYCYDCQQCLCTQCQKNMHGIVAVCRDHKVGDIHKAGTRIYKPVPSCDAHKKEFICYCVKCDSLICKECITSSHNGHITKEIKNIAEIRRQDVNQIIDKLKTKVEEIQQTLKTMEGSHSLQIQSGCESFIKDVRETSGEMYSIIDKYKHINITTASDFRENEEQDLKRKLVFFQRLHNESADRLLKFENLVQEPHDSTFFKEWKNLQTEFQIITDESEQQLSCPQQIQSFQPDTFRRAVIDKIDEQFQMGFKENERKVTELLGENCKLKAEVKIKLDEIKQLSNDLDTNADLTNKMRIYFEEKVKELEIKLKHTNDNNTTIALTDDAVKAVKYFDSTNARNDNPSDSFKPKKLLKQYMTSKRFKVHVVQDDITKMNVDAIICPQDDFCLSKGGIAKAIANASNERYRNDVLSMKTVKRCEVKKIVASPSTLPFKYVLHTVAPRWDKNAENNNAKFMKELGLTIRNILKHCSDSKYISTAALPVLGIGTDGHNASFITCASILSKEISQELQTDKLSMEELYIVTSEWGMASAVIDQFDKEKLFTPFTSFVRRKRHNQDSTDGTDEDKDEKRNRNSTTGAIPKSGTGKLGTTVKGGNLEDCVICMDTPDDPRRLNCGHIYCYNCISQHFKLNNPVCPTCGSIQGVVTGNQPPGTMEVYRRATPLIGYPGCGRIEIEYTIDSGRQGPEHLDEGQKFEGIRRIGYLPDTRKGQLVAKMLRVAFDRKLVFTIGVSRTTGKEGVVTWNDIHHKTNPKPYEQYGYPDDSYLDRVIEELSAKGVTERDIEPNTLIF